MIISLENSTNKTVKVNYSDKSVLILPNKTENLEISVPTLIEINYKRNEKTFSQRFKEDFSVDEVDLKYLRFKIKYSSYLKTVIHVLPGKHKRQKLDITESIYSKGNILHLNCLTVENSSEIDSVQYKCVDKQHKRAIYFGCRLAIFLKYGILGIFGLFAFLLLLFGADEEAGVLACSFVALIVCAVFFVMYMMNSVKLIKVLKKI